MTLSIWHGCRVFRHSTEPGEGETRFELPVFGTLVLIAPEAAPRLSIGSLFARVTAVDDPAVRDDLRFGEREVHRTHQVELLPGAYRVQLVHRWVESGERREELLQGVWRIELAAGPNEPVQL